MAMEANGNMAADNARLLSQLAAGTTGGPAPGNEQKGLLEELVQDYLPAKVANMFLKPVRVDVSNPENSAPVKLLDSQGIMDSKPMGFNAIATGQESGPFGWILKALKKVFSNSKIESQVEGVGGDAHGMQAATEIAGLPIEAPSNNIDFASLIGDSSGHGRYSVADISGGGTLTPIGPNMGSRGLTLEA